MPGDLFADRAWMVSEISLSEIGVLSKSNCSVDHCYISSHKVIVSLKEIFKNCAVIV